MTITTAATRSAAGAHTDLMFVRWADPVLDELGHDPRSLYAERFWLPVLGPTSVWMMRRLAAEFDVSPDGFSVDPVEFSRSIGIGGRGGRQSPVFRSIDRCIRFGLVCEEDHGVLGVRTKLPTVDAHALGRLPKALRDEHRAWQKSRRSSTGPASDMHAVRLVRSLIDVGADEAEIVAQLQRWHFDAGTSERALREAGCGPVTAAVSAGLAETPQELHE